MKNFYAQEKVARNYNKDRQSNSLSYKHRAELEILLELLRGEKGTVLEVACGTGRITKELFSAGFKVLPTDYSEAMLEEFREAVPEVEPRVADVTKLPFEKGSFNTVLCLHLFDHLSEDDQRKGLSELMRVSSGRVVLDVTAQKSFTHLIHRVLAPIYYAIFPRLGSLRKKTGRLTLERLQEFCWQYSWALEKCLPVFTLPSAWMNFLPSFPGYRRFDLLLSRFLTAGEFIVVLSKK